MVATADVDATHSDCHRRREKGDALMAAANPSQKVPFFMHDLGQAELDAVAEVLSGPILTTGEWVARFEERNVERPSAQIENKNNLSRSK